ncbi:MAG TPA: helix-turn-helix domain-containing protein, partial [Streptomyces sp.]|nr:helix-turn-helix domain-containing protein [Streptomyces sp.]
MDGYGRGRQGQGRGRGNPYELTDDSPVYVISVAAQLSGLHPQTLRQYDRLGLVSPDRAAGRGRRYSARDIQLLRQVQRLSQDEGINLAGVKRILELENHVAALQARIDELHAELDRVTGEALRR